MLPALKYNKNTTILLNFLQSSFIIQIQTRNKVGDIMLHMLHAYDVMAMLCHKIRLLSNEIQKDLYRAFWANPELAQLEIENIFSFLSRRNADGAFVYNTLSMEDVQSIGAEIEKWSATITDRKLMLYLLVYLDRYINFDESIELFFASLPSSLPNTCYFDCLNSNELMSWGKLLPRFEPNWAKCNSRGRPSLEEDPLSIMRNYIWVEDLGDWEISNVYSPNWTCFTDTSYTIVCSPVTNRPTFDYICVEGEDCNYYKITNYHEDDQELLLNRFERIMAIANTKRANIVLFPEMISSRESQLESQRITTEHWEYSYPRILCLPSSEFNDHGEWKNQTIVLNDSGHEVFHYNKQQAFQLDLAKAIKGNDGVDKKQYVKYFEPIQPDHKLTIMHVKGLGRIGVIICADIFNTELCNILLSKYEIRLLLIMAYTAGYDQFFREISSAQITSCDVIWCNTCAAYTAFQKKGPAVAYFSYGHRECGENLVPHCNLPIGTLCNGCVATITIDPLYSKPGSIYYEQLS